MTEMACEYCGGPFEAQTSRARFCSSTCKADNWYAAHPEAGRNPTEALQSVAATDLADTAKVLIALRAHPEGVHSHALRRIGITGNPSQRVAELEAEGFEIEHRRENRGKRPGMRYVLVRDVETSLAGKGSNDFHGIARSPSTGRTSTAPNGLATREIA